MGPEMSGVADDNIQRISMSMPKFSVYFVDVILRDPTQMSGSPCLEIGKGTFPSVLWG
jgi:hypothetical protein